MNEPRSRISFEELVSDQSTTLISCEPKFFAETFKKVAIDALQWFDIDRLTLFPNSMILLNDGKTISVSREGIPEFNKKKFVPLNYLGCLNYLKALPINYPTYLKLLRSKKQWHSFTAQELQNSKIHTLRTLYKEGGRWHGIIRLQLFGQDWGALSFSKFNDNLTPLSEGDIKRLKVLCNIWLSYWQHSAMSRNFKQDNLESPHESEKLLLLSKKQCAVLSLLAQGYSAKQCAEKLSLSPRTIESHKYRMLITLAFDNHTELIEFALRNGLGIEQ